MDQQETEKCDNCGKQLPSSKIATHFGYCRRNVKKCPTCGEMYDINFEEQHEEDYHKKEKCNYCKKQFSKNDIETHQVKCTMKPKFCQYCDQNIPPNQFQIHLKACQSRTKMCEKCGLPVTNKDFLIHITQCQGPPARQPQKERIQYNSYNDVSARQIQLIRREKERQLEERKKAQQRKQYANINYQQNIPVRQVKRQPADKKYTFNYPNQQRGRDEGRNVMERRQKQQRERKQRQQKLRRQRQAARQHQAQRLRQKRQLQQKLKQQERKSQKYSVARNDNNYQGKIGVVERDKYKVNRDIRAQQPISRNNVPDVKIRQPQPVYASKQVNNKRVNQAQDRKYDFHKKSQVPRTEEQYKQQYARNRKQQVKPPQNAYQQRYVPQQHTRQQYFEQQVPEATVYDQYHNDPEMQRIIYESMAQPKHKYVKQQIPAQFQGITDMNQSFYRDVALQQQLMNQFSKNKKKR